MEWVGIKATIIVGVATEHGFKLIQTSKKAATKVRNGRARSIVVVVVAASRR